MIRTTSEASCLDLWRDPVLLRELAHPQNLTTGRYEPILRQKLGSGQVDLLFETAGQSCVLGGIRLDASNLVTRERSPLIWPAHLAAIIEHAQLLAIEGLIVPWLRSIARARPMAGESIRRFLPSTRFNRARQADLVGAAPLDSSLLRMAPFVYARRFATRARVELACADAALGHAVLGDVAAVIQYADLGGDDALFARAWYGVLGVPRSDAGRPDIVITDRRRETEGLVVVATTAAGDSPVAMAAVPLPIVMVDVPSPVPWDLLFSFDTADAPAASRFAVVAVEPPIRRYRPVKPVHIVGGSSGQIVLAVSAEALLMRGPDVEEVEIFARRLTAEGFTVRIASQTDDRALADAQLVHIFGARFEPHTVAFAERALQRGIEFVFDLPPLPSDPSAFAEDTFLIVYQAPSDDADLARYLDAYERRRLEPVGVPIPTAEDYARIEARFAELSIGAAAILAVQEDLDALRAALPAAVAGRLSARCTFAEDEPVAAAIGHIVPRLPFAFVHAGIAARSHCLYAAAAAERLSIPLVVAGAVYDVAYLQALHAIAPSAIVLAEADAQTISALYRSATVWIDAAPRPRGSAHLLRAVACGALPVLAKESPLVRLAGAGVPTFALTSVDDCARTLREAIVLAAHEDRLPAMQARLLARRDSGRAFAAIMAAYSHTPTSV